MKIQLRIKENIMRQKQARGFIPQHKKLCVGFIPQHKKLCVGFTLIELLIVIGILAILATITLVVLNPAQMFAQARDSQRLSDLSSIKSAVSLYLAIVFPPSLDNNGGNGVCGTNYWGTVASSSIFTVSAFKYASATTSPTGAGWVPVALSNISGGSPISALPLDPVSISGALNSNTDSNYGYWYACNSVNKTFEIDAHLESLRYSASGSEDRVSTDGGDKPYLLEMGTDLTL